MAASEFDVLAIGNAIVDILARAEDDLLVRLGVTKGMMRLIDAAEADRLYDMIGPAIEASGGSAGNTAAGVASLGGRAAYVGKVATDELGRIFTHDIRALGVHFATVPLEGGAPTARSTILITPDGERTMNTYLGACHALTVDDIDPAVVAAAEVTYLEGYLWDPPAAKEAFRKAAAIAHANGRKVAITLSDSFCVDRWRGEFLELMRSGTVDVVFANKEEIHALYETSDLASAVAAIRTDCALAAVTLGGDGALAVRGDETARAPATAVDRIEDLTGAGDQFAAGFLVGLTRGLDLSTAVRLGCLAGSEVIGHVGPRPSVRLADLAAAEGITIPPRG
ncbi:adenosine kinase [Oharaeibacter diazotrophicus]|uniref:Sugar/nucleoside kinase (Ribokinase family) n=1 Tax=Oharaeibacter diazotrophicus TaxID=1920512 RepID=A0A4R6R7X7_9HYPH|nr:adenosine kinase [Oharaeibacter diazotrophicus]TDP82029.1 sugar/nucleoside kinase (ribokinase family) [Oharaeibacter diazotrophicus]BBE73661.1 carbohydrate kinase [Pleomorphomonas sp. SM30]GLS75450.1 adenosine kinase [Oharaeibacter diazotrophicus]